MRLQEKRTCPLYAVQWDEDEDEEEDEDEDKDEDEDEEDEEEAAYSVAAHVMPSYVSRDM